MQQYSGTPTDRFPANERRGGIWRIFIFMLLILAALVLGYIGLDFGYKAFLNNSINELDVEIEEVAGRFELEESRDLVAFYSQMVNLRALLSSHIFGSKVFPFLESSTNSRVAYSTVDVSTQENQIVIDGIAESFEVLVQQLLFWQRSPSVSDIILQENSLANDLVRFRVAIELVPNFFLSSPEYLRIISETPPAQNIEESTESEELIEEEN